MGDVEGRDGSAGQGELYRLACLAAEIGVWDWELSSGTISLCPLARKVLGLPSEGPICLADIRALTHPDDAVEMRAALDRALDPEIRSRESYVYRIRRGDSGDIRWLRANGVATFGIVEAGLKQSTTAARSKISRSGSTCDAPWLKAKLVFESRSMRHGWRYGSSISKVTRWHRPRN